jgi:hypothetical protein
MCEKIIEKMPSMTAEERLQLRRNCLRAVERSADALIVQEAKRVLAELDALEKRELSFLARLPAARRIEYAFRRLPASDRERQAIRLLHDHQGAPPDYLSVVWAEIDERTWHGRIGEMCRNRRHLLSGAEDRQMPEPPSAEPGDWSERLIEFDEDGRSVRLKPEAATAFASLGYVAREQPSPSTDALTLPTGQNGASLGLRRSVDDVTNNWN